MQARQQPLAEVDAFLAEHPDIALVDMLVPDMNGILRGKQLTPDAAAKLYTEGVRLPGSNYLLDWTGHNIPTLEFGSNDGDPDFFCFAAPGSLKQVPGARRKTAQVLASMRDANGKPHFADPRMLLAKVVRKLAALGLKPVIAIEYEFYLVDGQAAGHGEIMPARSPETNWRNEEINVYGLDDIYDFEALLGDIHEACAVQDLAAETIVSEYAPGQFEINLLHGDDALKACDNAILLERVIKQTAVRHGAIATFMAKPFAEHAGSGLHVHVSLLDKDGRNVFDGPRDKALGRGISPVMRQAIAGLVGTMAEAMAIFAPNANSYRRLRPETYAPVTGNWGGDNRSLAIRIPGSEPPATRIEHRVAGADANPYLVTAAVLAGIHHGIASKLKAPAPVLGDGYAERGVPLPLKWDGALEAFKSGDVLRRALGAAYCDCFHTARSYECERHHSQIPPLDYQWYLRTA